MLYSQFHHYIFSFYDYLIVKGRVIYPCMVLKAHSNRKSFFLMHLTLEIKGNPSADNVIFIFVLQNKMRRKLHTITFVINNDNPR